MSNLKSRFPDLLPMEEIRVGPEAHTYEVIEYDSTPNAVKTEYVPNKAPVLEVEDVSGIVDGEGYSFEQGTDYEVIDTDNDGRLETIDFDVGGESPDDNTEFEITYIARSIIVRYVESYADEFDRLADDIDEAIDSHYLDEATNTGYIDNFEDEEVVEYEFLDGGESNATVQSDTVLADQWALELNSPSANTPVTIASNAGLPRYPARGDTITYYVQLTDTDDIAHFDFMWAQNDAGNSRYYRTSLDASADEFRVQKNAGSVKQGTLSIGLDTYLGEWMRVEFEIEPIGTIEASLYDKDGTLVGSASITDTEYTNGGIRFAAENPNQSSEVYFDAADVIQRNSSDLDRIGAFFGELGKRRGRSDDEYATFLRSIVQSFSGRGTVDGIKFAVASALDLDPDQIVIEEDFVTNEYTVDIEVPFPPHELVTLTELADLADPSGVEFGSITYDVAQEQVDATDSVSVTTGQQISEETSIDDTVGVNPNLTTVDEQVQADDAAFVNPNLTTTADTMQADDTTAVNPNLNTVNEDVGAADTAQVDPDKTTVAEDTSADDTVATDETTVAWDEGSWDSMDWATEHN